MEEDRLHSGGQLRLVRELRAHMKGSLRWNLLLEIHLFESLWLKGSLHLRLNGGLVVFVRE